MLRFLGTLVLVAAGFAGGFYLGVQHRNDELLNNPEELMKAYQQKFKDKAADKMERIKQVLLED